MNILCDFCCENVKEFKFPLFHISHQRKACNLVFLKISEKKKTKPWSFVTRVRSLLSYGYKFGICYVLFCFDFFLCSKCMSLFKKGIFTAFLLKNACYLTMHSVNCSILLFNHKSHFIVIIFLLIKFMGMYISGLSILRTMF